MKGGERYVNTHGYYEYEIDTRPDLTDLFGYARTHILIRTHARTRAHAHARMCAGRYVRTHAPTYVCARARRYAYRRPRRGLAVGGRPTTPATVGSKKWTDQKRAAAAKKRR